MVILCCQVLCCYAKPTILVLGDSLSAPYRIPEQSGWVALLEGKLKSNYPQAKLINSSIVGATTGNGLQRLPLLLTTYQPDIVILELGGNDGLRGLPLPKIQSNLNQMLLLCQQQHAKVLLLGMRLPPNYGPYSEKFYQMYQTLSKDHPVVLVPFLLEGVALKPELLFDDHIHPTTQAQPLILQNVWPKLVVLLSH